MGRQSGRWFRVAVAAGFALRVLLLITTIYTFRYVVRHLIFDHLSSDAGQLVSQLEHAARTETPADGAAEVERLEAGAPVLGLLPDVPFLAGETHFGDGDLLIAFSDGLSEANNASDEEYGSTRVADAISTQLGRPPADILARILESVSAFRGSEPLHDDLSLLVVRAGPAAIGS